MYQKIFIILLTLSFIPAILLCEENIGNQADIDKINQRLNSIEQDINKLKQDNKEHIQYAAPLKKSDDIQGLTIGWGMTFILQGTNNANGDTLLKNGEDTTAASYSMDIELEKRFNESSAGFIHCESGNGQGVEDTLKVFSNVNRDTDDSDNAVSITEAWYEYAFSSLGFTITAGMLDPTVYIDTNEYANDETSSFLGHIFRNSAIIPFPDNSAAIRASAILYDIVSFDLLAQSGEEDAENIGSDFFYGIQMNITQEFFRKKGNYRFITWLDKRPYIRWDDATQNNKTGRGFGLSFDQEITAGFGVFARYGITDNDTYRGGETFSLENDISYGISLSGNTWGRSDDILGIGYGTIVPSNKYKEENNMIAKNENHAECFYNLNITDYMSLSPMVHIIWNPYGGDALNGDKTITVGGVRMQVNF